MCSETAPLQGLLPPLLTSQFRRGGQLHGGEGFALNESVQNRLVFLALINYILHKSFMTQFSEGDM